MFNRLSFQIQKTRSPKKKERKNVLLSDNTSAGEDSGIAGSDGSNPQSNVCIMKNVKYLYTQHNFIYLFIMYYLGKALDIRG